MSSKETERTLLAELGSHDCASDVMLEYRTHIRQTLRGKTFETTLGTATMTGVTVARLSGYPIRYHFTIEVEFPREDKSWSFLLGAGDSHTCLTRIQKTARLWATERAEQHLRAEDLESGILEIRRNQKLKRDKSLHGLFYFEGCDCQECEAHRRGLDERSLQADCFSGGDQK